MDRITTLKEKLKVSNDTPVNELSKITGVGRAGLFRWNKTGKAPATLVSFILGTKYRTVSNDTPKNDISDKLAAWRKKNPKATFISVDEVERMFTSG